MPLRVMLAPAATRRRYSPLPFHMCACVCPQRKPRVRSSRLVQLLCRGVVVASTSSQHHWGLPCTVSAGTCLFPPDLNPNLDITHLAATAGIESCFLCTNAGFSVFAAVPFAKELKAAGTYTVGDFVGIAHRQFAEALLSRVHMVRCLNLDVDIPANLHAASGTPGGCDMMLHESPALRDLRVTFMCLSRCLWRVEPFLRVTVPVRVCVIPLHTSRSRLDNVGDALAVAITCR